MEVLGGPLFGVAGAGESHGPAVTATVLIPAARHCMAASTAYSRKITGSL